MALSIPADSLMERTLLGHRHERELLEPAVFRDSVAALVSATEGAGNLPLVPASPAAAALIGGAMHANPSIQQAQKGPDGRMPNKLMIVEATAVSGLAVRRTLSSVRARGADWVSVWFCCADRRIAIDADSVLMEHFLDELT